MKIRKKTSQTPFDKIKSLVLSLFDSNVPGKRKWLVLGIILYIISPIDLIPDFVPIAGYADDVLLPILFLVAERLLSDKPEQTQTPNRPIKEAKKI